MAKNLRIWSSFTETVPAGTAVWFRAVGDEDHRGGAARARRPAFTWRVTGPFPHETVTEAGEQHGDDPTVFTLRTDGFRPGAYQVIVTRARDKGQGAEDGAPGKDDATGKGDPENGEGDGGTDDGAEFMAAADRSGLPPVTRADTAETGNGSGQAGRADVAEFTLRVAASGGPATRDGVVPVSLQRTSSVPTSDQVLWMIIRNRTDAISFSRYKRFIDGVMCGGATVDGIGGETLQYRGTGAYDLLYRATDAFLMQEMGVIAGSVVGDGGQAGLGSSGDSPTWAEFATLTSEQLAIRETSRLGFRPSKQQILALRDEYFEALSTDLGPVLPYLGIIRDRLGEIPLKGPLEVPPNCYGILRSRVSEPLSIELLWSYWHEEGMLVQAMNAILARFQNRRLRSGPDPLARLDLDPLRPLGNLIWGWAQNEHSRLTVLRRSAEYEHHYGVRLTGQALHPPVHTVDRRHKFLGAFHNLLFLTHVFFKEDDDTTVIADGFPVLNALRETHLLLAEGAHNQYGDLPSTARAEMLVMEWLLARPEMREFLGGRVMVPYAETWMDRVDTMKTVQCWTDVSVTHFRDLGVYGEQILLSVRFGNWSVANDPQQAANWARYWRAEIQRYTHAYRAATGVDLTARVDATVPTLLLQRRLVAQRRG